MGGCNPPVQHQPMCQPACNPGYQCGPYGCTALQARARGANVFQPDLEKEELKFINMYFKLDACPVSAAAEIQFCAAQGRDHRQCCARNGVGTTLAGDKCLIFCDQRPGNITQLDYSYLICYERFENIKSCFWNDMISRNSLKPFLRKY
ncbi:unnamed protein product [Onchocerca flexuosa]|uniref:DB domain-containing protein n=1 Tax=Onchocerca flexuosa TaxID=387005 RepID=A0A183I2V7_9BILA|nr:unnamed protein product [Onchocerca flexuosa]